MNEVEIPSNIKDIINDYIKNNLRISVDVTGYSNSEFDIDIKLYLEDELISESFDSSADSKY